jgi:hypothetical protein
VRADESAGRSPPARSVEGRRSRRPHVSFGVKAAHGIVEVSRHRFPSFSTTGRGTSGPSIDAASAVWREPGALGGRAARPVRRVDGRWGRRWSVHGRSGSERAHDRPRTGPIPRYDQQQLTHPRRLHAGRRLGDHPRRLDPARGESSLQLRACDAHLVRFGKRAQPCSAARPKAVGRGSQPARRPILRVAETQARDEENGTGGTVSQRRGGASFQLTLSPSSRARANTRSRRTWQLIAGRGALDADRLPECALFQAKPNIRHPTGSRGSNRRSSIAMTCTAGFTCYRTQSWSSRTPKSYRLY